MRITAMQNNGSSSKTRNPGPKTHEFDQDISKQTTPNTQNHKFRQNTEAPKPEIGGTAQTPNHLKMVASKSANKSDNQYPSTNTQKITQKQ